MTDFNEKMKGLSDKLKNIPAQTPIQKVVSASLPNKLKQLNFDVEEELIDAIKMKAILKKTTVKDLATKYIWEGLKKDE